MRPLSFRLTVHCFAGRQALDQGGDRLVTHVSEYAFTQYGGKTDLEGLRIGFDSNADGVFDAKDEKFAEFAGWQDADADGVSDEGEVKTLADAEFTYQTLQDLATDLLGITPEQLGEAVTPLLEGAQDLLASTDLTTLTLLGLNQLQLSLDNLGASVADLSNGVNDVLSIQLDDLLTLPTAADGTRQLQILGDAGDSVTLDQLLAEAQTGGTWSQSGTTTQNGHTFNVYQYSGDQTLQVLIDQQILQSNVQLS